MATRPSKQDISEIFELFLQSNPNPKSELRATNFFTFLVAVVLSAQSTDAGVNRVTGSLFAVADTPEKMARLGEEKLRNYIKSIGLFRTKARNIVRFSEILINKFGGQVPARREDLEALPGVGRKTANVILNICYGEPTIAVDTHIFRVGNRTMLAPGRTPKEVEMALLSTVPDKFKHNAHQWLILHGRHVCKARKPECWRCNIARYCKFKPKSPAPV